jgi:hypothetical protein
MRRVNCSRSGVRVESVPWAEGKRQTTISFEWFLSIWAKRLSWTETAQLFRTSRETVSRSGERAVQWGGAHADYSGIEAIGIDEGGRRDVRGGVAGAAAWWRARTVKNLLAVGINGVAAIYFAASAAVAVRGKTQRGTPLLEVLAHINKGSTSTWKDTRRRKI